MISSGSGLHRGGLGGRYGYGRIPSAMKLAFLCLQISRAGMMSDQVIAMRKVAGSRLPRARKFRLSYHVYIWDH